MKLGDGLAWFGAASAVATTIALGAGGWDTEEVVGGGTMGAAAAILLLVIYWDRLADWWYGIARDEIRAAATQDVEAIHALAREYIGEGTQTQAQIKSLIYRHKTMFWVLQNRDCGKTRYQIDGYVCLFPLTTQMVEAIESYSFSVECLTPANLPRRRGDVAAIYIGAIVGSKYRARYKILGFMENQLKQATAKSSTKTAYAKAVSQRGLRLLVNNDFVPVKPGIRGLNTYYKRSVN